jgi:threonine dehydrogenase-like Zn-dependent dehydrogenase
MDQDPRRTVTFQAPGTVEVVEEPIPTPGVEEVRVRTLMSAVSPGTERLLYRGEAPSSLQADPEIDALSGGLEFPLSYGYAAVGRVEVCGKQVSDSWEGRRVFSFQPHTSHFVTTPEHVIPLPDEVSLEDGLMIPSVETAVNLVMDGRPMIGERVVLFGQGVVGLLTTGLIGRHPVSCYTVEPDPHRRALSKKWQADESFHPVDDREQLENALESPIEDGVEGADLVYELSGNPSVLNHALSITGFDGRVVIGSWYGTKEAPLQLGGRFHRSRIQLKSSQVSTVDPAYQGRWTKDRRMDVVLDVLKSLHPGSLVNDSFSVEEAAAVYRMLDNEKKTLLQPVFEYR